MVKWCTTCGRSRRYQRYRVQKSRASASGLIAFLEIGKEINGTPRAAIRGSKPSPPAPPPITITPCCLRARIKPARKLYKVQAQRETRRIFLCMIDEHLVPDLKREQCPQPVAVFTFPTLMFINEAS